MSLGLVKLCLNWGLCTRDRGQGTEGKGQGTGVKELANWEINKFGNISFGKDLHINNLSVLCGGLFSVSFAVDYSLRPLRLIILCGLCGKSFSAVSAVIQSLRLNTKKKPHRYDEALWYWATTYSPT